MTNKEVIDVIKEVNKLVDSLEGLATTSEEYGSIMSLIDLDLDLITFDCPRWKYYHAWELHMSKRTGHYWVTFTQ